MQHLVLGRDMQDLGHCLQRLRRWLTASLHALVTGDSGDPEAVRACAEAEKVARTYGFTRLSVVLLGPPLSASEAGDLRAQVVGRLAQAEVSAHVYVFTDATVDAPLTLVLPEEAGDELR